MVSKKAPSKILITPEDIDRICAEYIDKDRISKIFWALVGIVIPSWLSLIIFDFKDNPIVSAVYLTVLSILTFTTIGFLIKAHKNNNAISIAQQIKAKAEINHSALFIISKIDTNIDGKRTIKILLQRKESWDCDFLPYVELKEEWNDNEYNDNLTKLLANKLNIRTQDLNINYIEDEDSYSIKLSVPDQLEKLFQYSFYNVTIKNNVNSDIFENHTWVDIDDLLNDVKLMRINGDVIDSIMRLKSKIVNSFETIKGNSDIKIIWNITNNCSFNCNICATKTTSSSEIDIHKKNHVLNSILTVKDSIRELNFAGGDPLSSKDSKKIIGHALNIFDESKISITTTGKSIHNLNQTEKQMFLKNCVLTIDMSSDEQQDIRKTSDYNRTNIRYANKYRNLFSKLRINVPILNSNVSEEELDAIIKKINEINPDEISLIKLMPVGKQKFDQYPQGYDALKIVNKIKEKVNDKIRIHLHCALRCDANKTGKECTMLTRKLGIDSQGNVFACCWAGYLDTPIENNPFYLGNLLEQDLKSILESNEAITLNETFQRQKCNIFEHKSNPVSN